VQNPVRAAQTHLVFRFPIAPLAAELLPIGVGSGYVVKSLVLLFKNLLFVMLLPGTVAVYLPLLIVRGAAPAAWTTSAVAIALIIAGTIIVVWCVWDFATFGQGTPMPLDAPRKLVVRGLYRYMRNPMYVGVMTIILGWSVMFQAWILVVYAVVVGACFHLFVVLYEERRLRHLFGKQYEDYCARVRRWVPTRGRASHL
jgi:protein-S-isoprenylcysteine O-methyltransferase Ste14